MGLDFNRLCLKCFNPAVVSGRCTCCGAKVGFIQEPAFALPAGTILAGNYLVGGVLGFGGFGITYLGLDLARETRVAIKEFMPAGTASRSPGQINMTAKNRENFEYGLTRFYDEARTVYKYRHHPNIVHVYKLFHENQTGYYVMEYLEGDDFKHFLRRYGGRTDFNTLMKIMLPVMDALECVHKDHVIHRDISPDNIFVGETVKLIDFGAARVALAGQSKSLSIILKKGFAPEEQYRTHGRQGPWTDIYALAGTMYYALSGVMVPEAPERLVDDELKDLRTLNVALPDYSAAAIMQALAVRAANRYQTVEDFRCALSGQTPGRAITMSPVSAFRLYGLQGFYAGASLTAEDSITLGRDPVNCQLVFPQNTRGVSKVHCRLRIDPVRNLVYLKDMNSTYGTWVNGHLIGRGQETALNCADRFAFGEGQVFEIEF